MGCGGRVGGTRIRDGIKERARTGREWMEQYPGVEGLRLHQGCIVLCVDDRIVSTSGQCKHEITSFHPATMSIYPSHGLRKGLLLKTKYSKVLLILGLISHLILSIFTMDNSNSVGFMWAGQTKRRSRVNHLWFSAFRCPPVPTPP